MSLKQAAMRGAVWSAIESVGIQLMSFVLFLILARLVDPHSFGIVQIASTVIGLLAIFVEQGFSMTIVQRRDISTTMLDTAFWIGVGIAVLVGVGLVAAAPPLAQFYESAELAPVLRVLALSIPLGATCGVQAALFIRKLDFRAQALRRLIAVLGGGVVGVGMAFAGFGVWSLVGRLAVESVLDCWVVWSTSSFRPGVDISRTEARALLSFGSRVVGSNLLDYLNRRADDLLIGFVLGPVALGYYAVAFRGMSLVVEVALRTAQRSAIPVFAALQAEPERLRTAYYAAIELAAVVACPVFLGLSTIAPELALTLFGAKWAPSIPSMQVLGLAGIGMAVSLYTGPMLIAVGKPNWFLSFSVVTALVNVMTSLVAVRWGLVAMAFGYVVRSYVLLPVALQTTRRAMGARPAHVLRLMWAPTFAAIVMAVVITLVRRCIAWPAPLALLLFVLLGASVYVGLMAAIARGSLERLLDVAKLARGAGSADSARG